MDGQGIVAGRERCAISRCKRQLLRCYGSRDVGSAVGCAEESHVLCKPCLESWFTSQNELRTGSGLQPLTRRTCPFCKTELRTSGGEMRTNSDRFCFGLLKLEWSW